MLIVLLVIWVIFALFGCWIASVKGRSEGEGLVLGFLFGPLGCLIEAVLPNQIAVTPPTVAAVTPEQAAQIADQRRRQYDAAVARERARQAKIEADRQESLERAAESRRQAWEWFSRVVIRFGWFRALPELAQPIVVGLGIALPVICVIVILLQPAKAEPSNETRSAPTPKIEQAQPVQAPPF